MKPAGRIITWIGALLLLVGVLFENRFGIPWAYLVLLLLVLLGAVALSIISMFIDSPVLVVSQLGCASCAFGQTFDSYYRILAPFGAFLMVVGASLLVAAIWGRGGWRPTTGLTGDTAASFTRFSGSRPTVPTNPEPSAGWYSDPGGEGAERYWSGSQWTDQVRS